MEKNTQEYLRRGYMISKLIESREEQLERFNCMTLSIPSSNTGLHCRSKTIRVIESGEPFSIACIKDLEQTLEDEINDLRDSLGQIIELINSVTDPRHRTILYEHYIRNRSIDQLCSILKLKQSQVIKLHNQAIEKLNFLCLP